MSQSRYTQPLWTSSVDPSSNGPFSPSSTLPYQPEAPVDYDVYNKALSVSDPRLAGLEGADPNAVIRKKIVRRVEVPYTRQVKVPTQTVQLVPDMVETKVPVKKLVQVPGYQTVNETYTEFEEREAIREKEVWVKKIVPERYIERVPVQRVRQVQKPTTLVKEVETYEVVQVPTTKKVLVDGYRVDEVQDAKVVEVEEVQDFNLASQPLSQPTITATRDLGRLPQSHLARSVGDKVFPPTHPGLRDVDLDSEVAGNTYPNRPFALTGAGIMGQSSRPGSRVGNQPNPHSFYRPSSPTSRNLNIHANNSTAPLSNQYGGASGNTLVGSGYVNANAYPYAGAYKKPASHGVEGGFSPLDNLKPLGIVVDETHTRHTDGSGVLVTNVDRGSVAAKTGLQQNDVITSVGGRPVNTVVEFAQLLGRFNGPVGITINRDGRRNIGLLFSK